MELIWILEEYQRKTLQEYWEEELILIFCVSFLLGRKQEIQGFIILFTNVLQFYNCQIMINAINLASCIKHFLLFTSHRYYTWCCNLSGNRTAFWKYIVKICNDLVKHDSHSVNLSLEECYLVHVFFFSFIILFRSWSDICVLKKIGKPEIENGLQKLWQMKKTARSLFALIIQVDTSIVYVLLYWSLNFWFLVK